MHGRRQWLGWMLAGLLAGAAATLPLQARAQTPVPIKAVFDLSEGLEQASRAIANIRNELTAQPDATIVVVAHGDGVKFLLTGAVDGKGRPFEAMVAALAARGVDFRICNNTLTAFEIPASKVIAQAHIVPSGVAEVLRLQAREGYVYFHP